MSEPMRCRDCEMPIRLVRSMTRPDGWIVLDASMDTDGEVRVHQLQSGAHGELLRGDNLAAANANGELLWMLHRRNCLANKPTNPKPDHVQLNLPKRANRRRSFRS
ncbi:hypothetical protein CH298_13285 [Rhodococcoides fascians]|nr:hypothetical protein CH303_13165 [Rhodococcus fascians]OZF18259.1 hypothetical protein CH298_13285 [Rhodococcus fascians]OZF21710.1 hypothetical protein CH297_13180 [Rhodococcus fascians]OZF67335.1 hypothetical protein CH308_13080 [Rhodococcus fascians]OZF70525.1 hypothetical protein CH307_13280 [Rhodococcus fascians]